MKVITRAMGFIVCVATACFCGCNTQEGFDSVSGDEGSFIPDPDTAIETLTISNNKFSYTMGNEGKRVFQRLDSKADLNDLNDFAMAQCWRAYLLPKLQKGERLNGQDIELVQFCMDVQINMVDALSVALLGDMCGEPGALHSFVVKMEKQTKEGTKELEGVQRQTIDLFTELKKNFVCAQDGVRKPMAAWGADFRIVPSEVQQKIFGDIRAANRKSHSSKRFWVWSESYLREAKGGKTAESTQATSTAYCDRWVDMRKTISPYVPELIGMRDALVKARMSQTDTQTRNWLQRVLAESENDVSAVRRYLDYAVYDMPFCVHTYRAHFDLDSCRGFFNDDEEKMQEVMSGYAIAIGGTEMLKHIRTPYAADLYAQLVKSFKKEMTSRQYKDFLTVSKLYKVTAQNADKGSENSLEAIQQ